MECLGLRVSPPLLQEHRQPSPQDLPCRIDAGHHQDDRQHAATEEHFQERGADGPAAATDSAPERKSPERTIRNHGMSHNNPTPPSQKNGGAKPLLLPRILLPRAAAEPTA